MIGNIGLENILNIIITQIKVHSYHYNRPTNITILKTINVQTLNCL